MRLHIRPHLGRLNLQKLRASNLAELYPKLIRESGLSARSVGHVHRVLHRALGHAVQWSLLAANPAANVSPPPVASEEVEILRPADVEKAKDKLKGRSIYPLFLVALGTGLRRGELLALRWQDVDLDTALLRVERSLEQTRQGLRFKAPKTRHGRRTVTLPGFVVAAIRAHRTAQAKLRLKLGLGAAAPEGLVFCHPEGEPLTPNALTRTWQRAAGSIGLRQSLHALRHTHASQLIASGLDILTISRRLGHGSPTVTLATYGHLMPNSGDRAAAALDAAFSSAGTE
jgi:integrase